MNGSGRDARLLARAQRRVRGLLADLGLAAPAGRPDPVKLLPRQDLPGVRGRLRVSHHGAGAETLERQAHRLELVPGPSYEGMEDNDLRGFLDGRFLFAWNQPGQASVRVGRSASIRRYGEFELFRTLQRWSGIRLPPFARVAGAELRLTVAEQPRMPVSLVLYRVIRDWSPGQGGVARDNLSPPSRGEVWWNAARHGEEAWGLPGAGFASHDHPGADTDAMPLADALLEPGSGGVSFSSPELTSYCRERVSAGLPLLLLLKLSDADEDLIGSLVGFASASEGDDRTPHRRPRLILEWEGSGVLASSTERVFLEQGRSLTLARRSTAGGRWHALSFVPDPGYAAPTLEVRGGKDAVTEDWRVVTGPVEADWDWLQVRLAAVQSPVELGDAFVARFRDTWVRTAAPEEQAVPWTFTSPTGVVHEVQAAYRGAYAWEARFTPDEVGRWRYSWRHAFADAPYRSAEGAFDVVLRERERARRAVLDFAARVRALDSGRNTAEGLRLHAAFARLERAALQLETPETFHTGGARSPLGLALDEAREALSGQPVPERIALTAHPPAPWQVEGGAPASEAEEQGEGKEEEVAPEDPRRPPHAEPAAG